MQTNFTAELLATDRGQRANEILRSCVHCGFCNATCPTYQLTGDELDGPRGRIYLIRDLLEGVDDSTRSQMHLDRCLTCRACETTCPSGVAYGELAEIARNELGPSRRGIKGWMRLFIRWLVPDASRLRRMARLGKITRPFIPARLKQHIPQRIGKRVEANAQHTRKVLLLNGCAQQVATENTNKHLRDLLDQQGIGVEVASDEGCCGALDLHLGDESKALDRVRRNVDALSAHLDSCEAIISTASGCGVTLKDYGRLLAADSEYAEAAALVSAATLDVVEFVERAALDLRKRDDIDRVAWHAPCSLQHGMQITGSVERCLESAGYELVPIKDPHLCCGSAGSYSMLEPEMSDELGRRKVEALLQNDPEIIATANVGCQSHLGHRTGVPVVHWLELLV
ncbi:MAG: glycolate oxidase subunit GlcF [Pseudomonadales bacterium]|nr:glycolate oxidase subunit GlcF [Pseudomonadales bacterium]